MEAASEGALAVSLSARLRGGAAEREAAYADLLQREAEHSANSASRSAASQELGEELRGLKLTALRARALLAEHDPKDVEAAMDADDPRAELVQLLLSAPCSASLADIAVACTPPLCEVLCMAVSEVDAAEWQRAMRVFAALSSVEPVRVGAEASKPDQCNQFRVKAAPDSALGVVLAKDPASLTPEDALIAAWPLAAVTIQISTSTGMDAICKCAGMTGMEWIKLFMPTFYMMLGATPSERRNLVLCPLLLDLLRAPEKLPEFALVGVLAALLQGLAGRPAVVAKALKLDAIDVLMRVMRQASPAELIATAGFARHGQGTVIQVVKELCEGAQPGGIDLTTELVSCGFIDLLVSALSAVEQVGAQSVNGWIVVQGGLGLLRTVDGEALPEIEAKVRAAPEMLRFLVDNKIAHCEDFGFTSATFGSIVAAQCYGRDEDNTFRFAESEVDGFLALDIELLRCQTFGGIWALLPSHARPLLSLCISDSTKGLLLARSGFIPHLVRLTLHSCSMICAASHGVTHTTHIRG